MQNVLPDWGAYVFWGQSSQEEDLDKAWKVPGAHSEHDATDTFEGGE
jgi:hypothetical protein